MDTAVESRATGLPTSLSGVTHDNILLPGELWSEIAENLDPLSALTLSEVCRALHVWLTEKSLWIGILRSIIARQGPFIPSYSLGSMSVQELQRAAAGPQRWRIMGEKKAIPHGDLANAKPVDPKLSRTLGASYTDLRLVPGGRFVVTLKVQDGRYPYTAVVAVWDIGPPGDASHMEMVPVSQYEVVPTALGRDRPEFSISEVFVVGESCLRVVVSYLRPPRRQWRFTVLECALGSPPRSLVQIGSFDHHHSRTRLLRGDYVLIHSSMSYFLWNCTTQRAASWSFAHDDFPGPEPWQELQVVILADGYVVTMTPLTIRVWDISRLEFLPPGGVQAAEALSLPPHATLTPSWPFHGPAAPIMATRIPHKTSLNSALFDVFHRTDTTLQPSRTAVRYEVTIHRTRSDGYSLSLLPVAVGRLPPNYLAVGDRLSCVVVGSQEAPDPLSDDTYWPYLFQLADTHFPDTNLSTQGAAQEIPPAKLVPLLHNPPSASCSFSGRILHHSGVGERPILCVDYI